MSINALGIEGEKIARQVLKANGFNVFGGDWIATDKKGNYYLVEVKNKELYSPPPFLGTGLNISQVVSRSIFQKKTGIRVILFNRNKNNGVCYWQFLDKLEEGKQFDTPNKIRIYPIESFESFKQLKEENED